MNATDGLLFTTRISSTKKFQRYMVLDNLFLDAVNVVIASSELSFI